MPYQYEALLEEMVFRRATDLYLTLGCAPTFRIADTLVHMEEGVLDAAALEDMITQILSPDQRAEFEGTLEFNTGFALRDVARFRINVMRQRLHPAIVIRRIQTEIPSLSSLNLPNVYADIMLEKRGLVLVVGPTGSGKTTSLAAMVGHRNRSLPGHIITIEDPIEYVHTHDQCIISQRDVGLDTYSFSIALKNTLRQRPDVVVIGEIRDREVMEQAMYFSETGHLCLATLHASNASQTIDRIINFFPEDRHHQVLLNLSLNLKAVFSQRLVENLKGGKAIANEILLNNGLIKQLIENGKVRELREMIERGANDGMITFDHSLFALYAKGIISAEVAIAESENPGNVRLMMKQAQHGSSFTIGNEQLSVTGKAAGGIKLRHAPAADAPKKSNF